MHDGRGPLFDDTLEQEITKVNFETGLSRAQLAQDFAGISLLIYGLDADDARLNALMQGLKIPNNGGHDVITPGYRFDVMDGQLSIIGNDAVKEVIAAGYRFPGIELIAEKLGVEVPNPPTFTKRYA